MLNSDNKIIIKLFYSTMEKDRASQIAFCTSLIKYWQIYISVDASLCFNL